MQHGEDGGALYDTERGGAERCQDQKVPATAIPVIAGTFSGCLDQRPRRERDLLPRLTSPLAFFSVVEAHVTQGGPNPAQRHNRLLVLVDEPADSSGGVSMHMCLVIVSPVLVAFGKRAALTPGRAHFLLDH